MSSLHVRNRLCRLWRLLLQRVGRWRRLALLGLWHGWSLYWRRFLHRRRLQRNLLRSWLLGLRCQVRLVDTVRQRWFDWVFADFHDRLLGRLFRLYINIHWLRFWYRFRLLGHLRWYLMRFLLQPFNIISNFSIAFLF